MKKATYISLIFIIMHFSIAFALSKEKGNVSAKLYSNKSEIAAGDEIILAVEFKIKNNWHIYWENPGDAGMATTLEFSLPDGFEAGKVLYPYPDKFKTEGLTSYGYKNKTVLLTKIKVPNNLKVNSNYKINVKALWLECKDICIPGETDLELTLKATPKAKATQNNTFSDYSRKIPKSVQGLVSNIQILEKSAKIELKFPDYFEHNSLNFDIFPLNQAIFAHSQKPKITKDKNKFLIELDFDPFKVELPEKLEFVLVLDDKNSKIIDSKSIYFYVNSRN
jgi:thiol:disulfide interchange protein DsbD